MNLDKTYIQYGVPNEWALHYASMGLAVSSFKKLSKKVLIEKYKIPDDQVSIVKEAIIREPVDEEILDRLLSRNRFTCCICRGQKGDGYIIHHIESYSASQNNSYENLAVLCPNDHDLVHREGQHLTQKITKEQVKKAKYQWELKVEELDVQAACIAGSIGDVDFINAPRVLELYQEIFKSLPNTRYSSHLLSEGIIDGSGGIRYEYIKRHAANGYTPFMFFGPQGAWHLSNHFGVAFNKILSEISFVDLDDLLNRKALETEEAIGKYCYYVGGLYGKTPNLPITENTPPTHLYFHRRNFWVEWLVDARYMVSGTALHRLGDHNQYLIYGVIRNTDVRLHNGKNYIHIDIRPYYFGIPVKTKSRRPAIHYIEKYKDVEDEDDIFS